MKCLLDTHALLWMVADDPRLTDKARQCIRSADELYWSVVSLWEIGIKLSLRRLDFRLKKGWEVALPKEMERNGVRCLTIEPSHCGMVATLPWHHRDPFDRLLIAQAMNEQLALVSKDVVFDQYRVQKVWS